MKKAEAEEVFADVVSRLGGLVISQNCPRCGSEGIGYFVPGKLYDCHNCGYEWKNEAEE